MKFYVKSQSFSTVVAGPHIASAEEAAVEAYLKHYKNNTILSPLTIVSERGFEYMDHDHNEDQVFDTLELLSKAGIIKE